MEIREIKKIIELMKQNELTEFELQEEDFRIAIKRGNGLDHPVVVSSSPSSPVIVPGASSAAPATPTSSTVPAEGSSEAVADDEDNGMKDIPSPIVGTFFRASSPEAEPFVSVGQEVEEDTVVCIIEAMKVMNEIKAETKGIIRKVLVEDGTSVEYGQPLFQIEPL